MDKNIYIDQEHPVVVIDNVLPLNLAELFYSEILSGCNWSCLIGGTSGITQNWVEKNTYNNLYEQFQFSSYIKNENSLIDANMWHIVTLPFTLACLKLGVTYFIDDMLKCKVNIQTKAPIESTGKYNFPHTDLGGDKREVYTALYYVNDSDGDTYIFDKHQYDGERNYPEEYYKNLKVVKQISPKMGRMVFFKASQLHAGAHPVVNDKRIVINYNCKLTSIITEKLEEEAALSDLFK